MKLKNIEILKWDIFKDYPIDTGITTRKHGLSKPPFNSFNLATHTGDNIADVISNREILCKYLDVSPNTYTHGVQVHGDIIHRITKDNIGSNNVECDALITDCKDILINIFVADCVPIIIYDKRNNIAGLCHCGWKGTQKKLIGKMIKLLIDKHNTQKPDILIGIGPSIGLCCYNVSEELYGTFKPKNGEGLRRGSKFFLDLKHINKNQILDLGISEKNIEVMDKCTSCENELLYSFRKEGEPSGRFSCYMRLIS